MAPLTRFARADGTATPATHRTSRETEVRRNFFGQHNPKSFKFNREKDTYVVPAAPAAPAAPVSNVPRMSPRSAHTATVPSHSEMPVSVPLTKGVLDVPHARRMNDLSMQFDICLYLHAERGDDASARDDDGGQTICLTMLIWARNVEEGRQTLLTRYDPDGTRGAAIRHIKTYGG